MLTKACQYRILCPKISVVKLLPEGNVSQRSVSPLKQITHGPRHQKSDPPASQMLRPVVNHVAALAERLEIPEIVVRRIVIQVGGGENDPGAQAVVRFRRQGCLPADRPTPAVTPALLPDVPPPPIPQMADKLPMRSAAPLAATLGTLEPYHPADLRPVNWVEPAVLRTDRHQETSGTFSRLARRAIVEVEHLVALRMLSQV